MSGLLRQERCKKNGEAALPAAHPQGSSNSPTAEVLNRATSKHTLSLPSQSVTVPSGCSMHMPATIMPAHSAPISSLICTPESIISVAS